MHREEYRPLEYTKQSSKATNLTSPSGERSLDQKQCFDAQFDNTERESSCADVSKLYVKQRILCTLLESHVHNHNPGHPMHTVSCVACPSKISASVQ